MTEEKFVYGEQTFTYEKSDKEWKLSLRRSDVATQDLRELLILVYTIRSFGADHGCG